MAPAPEQDFHVVIVGAGFGGLGCAIACRRQGFKVSVFDQVPKFLPIGDSIGFGPNTSRLFKRWGMMDKLEPLLCNAVESTLLNYDGTVLGVDPTHGTAEKIHGHRALITHRGDAHMIFLDFARQLGVSIRMNEQVVDYDNDAPSITLANGEVIRGDVVIAADGVRSMGRKQVLGYFDAPMHSGYAVWRAFADTGDLRNDPQMSRLFEKADTISVWIGPDIHGLVITVRNGEQINVVLTHKDSADIGEGWTFPGNKEEVLKTIEGWDPVFVKVWEHMPEKNILDWKLVYRPCLTKWVADSGLVAICGDAAHPFLPSSSQGASQAIEDGATVALCLAKAGKGNVPLALHTFFKLRYEHVAKAQKAGITQREKWHKNHDESGALINKPDAEKGILESMYLWSHDCEKYTEENWDAVSKEVAAQLAVESAS